MYNVFNSIEYVYGGGNQATVPGTKVKIYGGNVIGNVFGGGNNADVTAKGTDVSIYGGNILNVYGGNNNGGTVTGNIKVTVDAQAEGTGSACTMAVGNVYGAGNIASYTGSPVVDFINGTSTGSVFGGGKGKEAVVVGNPVATIGDWTSSHHVEIGGNVFGGGYGKTAVVTGNPTVNINMIPGKFDPDKAMATPQVKEEQTIATGKLGTIGTVFGGGNAANVVGNTNVNIGTKTKVTLSSGDSTYKDQTFDVKGVNITGNVYGGGNAADVTGKTNVTVGK